MRSFDLVSAELVAFELLALLFVVRAAVSTSGASAKEKLDRRYAGGEITREDYLTIRDDMKRDGDA